MAGERRRDARIDPDEQHTHAMLDPVGQPQVFVVRLWMLGFRL
jgi:hypothetical protein